MRMTAPIRRVQFKPAFWGVERDFKDVMDSIENIWEGEIAKTHNFKETEKAYLLSIDLPGVNKKSLELQQEGEHLEIKGTRKNAFYEEDGESEEDKTVLRTVALPNMVDKEKIEAHLEDGVLYLAMPKIEKAIPRKIDINEGLAKAAAFGVLFSAICTYKGYNTKGGAKGVGEATNGGVVNSMVLIIVANFFLTYLFRLIRNLWAAF